MTDRNPLLAMWIDQHDFVGASSYVENEIMPLPEQLAFGIGDCGMLAGANTPLERDFAMVQGLNPEECAETYPDWEERLLKSYVLVTKFSKQDPELSMAWVSRVKVLPISAEHYAEALTWLEESWPDEAPDWTEEYHQRYTDALALRAPEVVPHRASCPYCQSRHITLEVVRKLTYTAHAGVITIDGKEKFVPSSDTTDASTHIARLRCADCKAFTDPMEDDEWTLPGISN